MGKQGVLCPKVEDHAEQHWPCLIGNLRSRQHLAGMAHKVLQQGKLFGRQLDEVPSTMCVVPHQMVSQLARPSRHASFCEACSGTLPIRHSRGRKISDCPGADIFDVMSTIRGEEITHLFHLLNPIEMHNED